MNSWILLISLASVLILGGCGGNVANTSNQQKGTPTTTVSKPKTAVEIKEIADYRQMIEQQIKSQETKSESEIEAILAKSSNRDPKYLQDYKNALEKKYSQKNVTAKFTESDDEILNNINSLKNEIARHQTPK